MGSPELGARHTIKLRHYLALPLPLVQPEPRDERSPPSPAERVVGHPVVPRVFILDRVTAPGVPGGTRDIRVTTAPGP